MKSIYPIDAINHGDWFGPCRAPTREAAFQARVIFLWLASTLCLGLSAAVAASPWPEPPNLPPPGPGALQRLQAGEVIVEYARVDESGGAARVDAVFHVEVESLWATIGNCAANLRFVRGLRECELLSEDERTALTRQRLKPGLLLPTLDYEFETVREPYEWIRIRLVEGELKSLEASWRFTELENGALLVSHEARVRPRFPTPRWMTRRAVQRDLERLFHCLRWEVRGWPDSRQDEQDRQACPDDAPEVEPSGDTGVPADEEPASAPGPRTEP